MANTLRLSFLVLMLASFSRADNISQDKLEYEKELAKIKVGKPTEYAEFQRLSTFVAEMLLARLGYDVGPFDAVLDEKTRLAVKAYERNRKIPVTGDPMSFETRQQIKEDSAELDHQPVDLPIRHLFLDSWDPGYVSAQGTWTMSGEESGMPEQTSLIKCDRQLGTCIEATGIVNHHELGATLSVNIETYGIERWDEVEIVTKPLQFGCVRYTLRINRTQKSVSGIRSTTSDTEHCKFLDNTEKYLTLEDGFSVWQKLSDKRKRHAHYSHQ